ncbi:hypothetical protein FRB95_013062 [Tulasnella sp. JGI-2019a]|nr:hypothetical protein FRB95_013062 [Tulasnella sp. JGI-2019a]
MSSSNAFIRDPASHPSQSFVKAFSDNQSPADADAPNADIAAVPGHMNENADPTPFVPVDANRAIEEGYATIQVKSQELMNRMGAGMPDRNKGAEEGYVEVQDMLGDSGAFRETVPVKTMGGALPDVLGKVFFFLTTLIRMDLLYHIYF